MDKMPKINEYYAAALKAQLEQMPSGFRKVILKKTGTQTSQITDIIHGRRSASEERRRAIAHVLGWDYEEFLRYGECLVNGEEYAPQEIKSPNIDEKHYASIPVHDRLTLVGSTKGVTISSYAGVDKKPLLINKSALGGSLKKARLIAFEMPDDGMEPTIRKNCIVIADLSDNQPENDKIYICLDDPESGSYTVRRVKIDGEDIFLIKDNNCHPNLLKKPAKDVIAGQVVLVWLDGPK